MEKKVWGNEGGVGVVLRVQEKAPLVAPGVCFGEREPRNLAPKVDYHHAHAGRSSPLRLSCFVLFDSLRVHGLYGISSRDALFV